MYLRLTVPHLLALGFRSNMSDADLSDILPEDVEEEVKTAAEISMGTEVWMKQCAYLCIRTLQLLVQGTSSWIRVLNHLFTLHSTVH